VASVDWRDTQIIKQDVGDKGELVVATVADAQKFISTFIVSRSQNEVCIYGSWHVSCHAFLNGKLPFVLIALVVWEGITL
jgi:hypothetical protein